MLTTRSLSISLLAGLGAATAQAPATTDEAPTVSVYLLAGQSNMEGQAVVGLDHEQHYNGGRGNLEEVLSREEEGRRFAHLRDERGALGSRLHRGDDGVWYGYAQWPDAETRRVAFADARELPAREQMRAAIAESLPEILLEPVADYLLALTGEDD